MFRFIVRATLFCYGNDRMLAYYKEQYSKAHEELRRFDSDQSLKILSLNKEKREKIRAKLIKNIHFHSDMMDVYAR